LGTARIRKGLSILGQASIIGAAALARRIAPMSAVLLLGPYFAAYALPWYSRTHDVPAAVGAFSIGYRLIIGLYALVVPMVLYLLARMGENRTGTPLLRAVGLSLS